MCGIFGAVTTEGLQDCKIREISNLLFHRGPDDEGFLDIKLEGKRLQFVHRRLSIIDLSSRAHQPMSYDDQNLWIVYNGEIFNYKELKEQLRLKGYRFKSESDTEVILASYKEWGKECVRHFNGDWAFCIYDKNRNELFLSRDRLGVKPLYYYFDKDNFVFSSEIKTLLGLPFITREWNKDLVCLFIILGISDFSQYTMYKRIYQLEPASNAVFNLSSYTLRSYRYWNPSYNKDKAKFTTREELRYARRIRELLEDSVRLRLRADVKVGTCLSGGIDSSIVVMIINNILKRYLPEAESVGEIQKTFTASYEGESIDEKKWVEYLTKNIDVRKHFVYPLPSHFYRDMSNFVFLHDEPVISTSVYAQYKVMELSSKNVKVVLDGQGADELFAGYWAEGNRWKRYFYSSLNRPLKRLVFKSFYSWKIRFLKNFLGDFDVDFVADILAQKMPSDLNRHLFLDETRYNLPQLLRYEDRNSMGFSVEARVPFTDYRLVEYVLNMPSCYKIHNGWTKYILRKAFEDLLPSGIIWRRDKIGFETPEKNWLMHFESFSKFLDKYGIHSYNGDSFWWRLFNFLLLDR